MALDVDKVDIELEKSNALELPEDVKIHIAPELWNRYSDVRRQSLIQMFTNPNSFFYRNRPPGDRQRYGPFTAAEEELFMERLQQFRDLGLTNLVWGLFAVPLSGRVGYQCSNFYRLLVKSKKVHDDSYVVTPDGKLKFVRQRSQPTNSAAVKKLENEAIQYTLECMRNADEIVTPVKIEESGELTEVESRTARSRPKRSHVIEVPREKEPEPQKHSEPAPKTVKKKKTPPPPPPRPIEKRKEEPPKKSKKKKPKPPPEPPENPPELPYNPEAWESVVPAPLTNDSDEYEYEDNDGYEYDPEDDKTAAKNAPDPITGRPIQTPMIDLTTGLVMDEESWDMVMNGKAEPPINCGVPLGEPIRLTKEVFHRYRMIIVGINV